MKAERAIQELLLLRDEARLDQVRRPGPDHKSWRARTGAVLTRSLGEDTGVVREFCELQYHVGIFTGAPGEAEADARYFAARVDDAASLVDAAIYELRLLDSDEPGQVGGRAADRGAAPRHFVDDDGSYLRWLSDHPDGYVINTNRHPGAGYLVLHRADCRMISGPSSGTTFTGDYSKVCGDRDQLDAFVEGLGGEASPCGVCLGRPASAGNSRSRYGPLRDYLAGLGGADVQLTFTDIERLVGRLPESARRHRAWWSNSSTTSRAWRDAGWRLQSVDQASGRVIFVRAVESEYADGATSGQYIDAQVITALRAADGTDRFNRSKLVRLICELNDNYGKGNTYAAHALLRAVLDHIPPLLRCPDFEAVTSNYSWGRTDQRYMRKLLDFKLQADDVLHRQISARADLLTIDDMPPRAWVNRLLQECSS